jgi:hypothetical protein
MHPILVRAANQESEGNRRFPSTSWLDQTWAVRAKRVRAAGRSDRAAAARGYVIYVSRMGTYTPRIYVFDTSRLASVGVFFASVSLSPLDKEMKSRPDRANRRGTEQQEKEARQLKPSRLNRRCLHYPKGRTAK